MTVRSKCTFCMDKTDKLSTYAKFWHEYEMIWSITGSYNSISSSYMRVWDVLIATFFLLSTNYQPSLKIAELGYVWCLEERNCFVCCKLVANSSTLLISSLVWHFRKSIFALFFKVVLCNNFKSATASCVRHLATGVNIPPQWFG